MIHGVTRSSLVQILKYVFGNHLDILKSSTASVDNSGILHLRQGAAEMTLAVQTVDFPVLPRSVTIENALGVLESTPKSYKKLSLLVSAGSADDP